MVHTIAIDWQADLERDTFDPPLKGGPLAQDMVFWAWDKKVEKERTKEAKLKRDVYEQKVLPALQAVLQVQ